MKTDFTRPTAHQSQSAEPTATDAEQRPFAMPTGLRQYYGLSQPVQRILTTGAPTADENPAEVQAQAARGVAASTSPVPHCEQIQSSFGKHSIGGIGAAVGGEAAGAARAIGAEAYASAGAIAFGSTPDVKTAAHETTHAYMQQQGVGPSGVGQAGDAWEQHADSVAEKVAAGESAEPLLDQMAPSGGASGTQTQRTLVKDPNNTPATDQDIKGELQKINATPIEEAIAKGIHTSGRISRLDKLGALLTGLRRQNQALVAPTNIAKGKLEAAQPVGNGASVQVATEGSMDHGGQSLTDVFSICFSGPGSEKANWLQFIWRKISGDTGGSQTGQVTSSATYTPYNYTTDEKKPNYNVDSSQLTSPYYEDTFATTRDGNSIGMYDAPTPVLAKVKEQFKVNGVSTVTSKAHFNTYLIFDGKPLHEVEIEVVWVFTDKDDTNKVTRKTSVLKNVNVGAIDTDQYARLMLEYPWMNAAISDQ